MLNIRPYILTAAALLFAGCVEMTPLPQPIDPDSFTPVRIGVVLPLSGEHAEYGSRILRGIELAAMELNGRRGISGRKLELLTRDSRSDPMTARRLTEELADAGITGLVGPYSSDEALAMKDVIETRLIPTVVPMATADELTSGTRLIYRSCFTDSQQALALAAYTWYWRKMVRVAVILNVDDEIDSSRGVARSLIREFREMGGETVGHVEFNAAEQSFETMFRDLVVYGPQAILICGEPDQCGELVRRIREINYNGLLLGPDTWDEPAFLDACGDTPGDCAFIGFYAEEFNSPEQIRFRGDFRKHMFVYPSSAEAQGYDALNLLAIGLGQARSVQDFNRNMLAVANHPGAAALYTMRPGGGIDRTMFIKTIRPPRQAGDRPESRLSRSFTVSKLESLKDE